MMSVSTLDVTNASLSLLKNVESAKREIDAFEEEERELILIEDLHSKEVVGSSLSLSLNFLCLCFCFIKGWQVY